MKTLIKDEELEMELQELYLTGKQWLSDVEFLANEESFLREQLSAMKTPASCEILARLDSAALINVQLGQNIADFTNKVEPLIVGIDSVVHLQLVEDFACLQEAMLNALTVLKGIKYALVESKRAA